MSDDGTAAGPEEPLPPFHVNASGLYIFTSSATLPPTKVPPTGAVPLLLLTEELRVDVDGEFPTGTISGAITSLFDGELTWFARVTRDGAGNWTGPISYRDGNADLRPHTQLTAKMTTQLSSAPRKATVTFTGAPGVADLKRDYPFETWAFRKVSFEYDTVSDATAVTEFNPATHPNHPAGAPGSRLTIEGAFVRAGIQVTKSGGDDAVPFTDAGPETSPTWSDQEMHDAMQAHWSRWKDSAQWAAWVLFARQHDMGTNLGGIMFDLMGAAQRQGAAIFSESFIADAPAGEEHPEEWVQRMRFWTAVHEVGHTFNLAHSWDKSRGTPWLPMADDRTTLSYMNYPYDFPGGTDAFFAAFEYTFSPAELLFLRHAPKRFVEQGAEAWATNHGFVGEAFERLRAGVFGPLALELRVHRETDGSGAARHEFLEPVVAELVLRNTSTTAVVTDPATLAAVTIVVQKDGEPAKRWAPFAHYCTAPDPRVLAPGEAVYRPVFLSAGAGGWLISEPGAYTAYAAADVDGGTALSAPLRVVVGRPPSRAAEALGDDVFTPDVAHTLAFGGSRVLGTANATLREVVDKLPGSRAAVHASSALGAPKARDGKVLVFDPVAEHESVSVVPADPTEARALLSASLADYSAAADSLGHIGVTAQTRTLAAVLAEEGDTGARTQLLNTSADTLSARGVLPGVVAELRHAAQE